MDAFKAHDRSGQGVVYAAELRHILTQFGDKMSTAEGVYNPLHVMLTLCYGCMFAFIVLDCSSVLSQEIGWEERL